MENILVDESEKTKREARLKRFGEIDKDYLNKISTKKGKGMTPDDIRPINPKESYKLMLPDAPVFDKKKVMMFGVNLMSTSDIEVYFNRYDFKVKKIYWLNDFSCIAEFDNEDKALEAYWKMTKEKYDGEKSDKDNYDWKPAEKETLFNFEMDIELRIADTLDVARKSQKKESVYYRFYNQNNINSKQSYNTKRYHNNSNRQYRFERSREKDNNTKEQDD